jgi:hypothetical protein
MDEIPVVPAKRLPSMLLVLPTVLGAERVAELADEARVRIPHRRLTAGIWVLWRPLLPGSQERLEAA